MLCPHTQRAAREFPLITCDRSRCWGLGLLCALDAPEGELEGMTKQAGPGLVLGPILRVDPPTGAGLD